MNVVGIDAHKKTHTLVMVDHVGQRIASTTVAANSSGHLEALQWARSLTGEVRFAVEDCRHLTRRLEADLLQAGAAITRVPTWMMAAHRTTLRERGKSDPIDAHAVALAALREPGLPTAELPGESRTLRLLVDHRENLVWERTRVQSRIRWQLHEIDPNYEVPERGLKRLVVLDTVAAWLAERDGLVVELCAELISMTRALTVRINELERRIERLARQVAPSLLAIPGCGALTAAKLVGETAGASRFKSADAFARFNGTAPIPVWSSNTEVVRLSRGGNRQVNAAIHRIAITQWRGTGPGHDYIERKMKTGATKTKAIRSLRRHLSDVVFSAMLADEHLVHRGLPAAA